MIAFCMDIWLKCLGPFELMRQQVKRMVQRFKFVRSCKVSLVSSAQAHFQSDLRGEEPQDEELEDHELEACILDRSRISHVET